MTASTVYDRIEALRRFTTAAQPYLPESELAAARALAVKADERLALSRAHTVVALAGATGTGKSSIFNALAGLTLSQAGLRRPTTGQAHACVWGDQPADDLLDWLGVGKRFARPGGTDPDLSGLVLLDLPDFDSVHDAHRAEVDRLLKVVDQIVWVLHPQKYADRVVHHGYLARFHRHREITVVDLNQVDLLSADDLQVCLLDLRRLLADDGLADVPVLTSSTVGPPGLSALADTVGAAVAARQAAQRRLAADVDDAVADLGPLVAADLPKDALGKQVLRPLTDALARAAGVPLVADATERAYVHRARKRTGWPPLRWVRRLRPDPLIRLHLGGPAGDTPPGMAGSVGATSISPAAPAEKAAVALTLRDTAGRAGADLPAPWRDSLLAAVRSGADGLPDALDRAVASTDLGVARPRAWWRVINLLQWIFALVALAGLVWLGVRWAMFALALPQLPLPQVAVQGWQVPTPTALLAGGLLAGLLLSLLVRPVVRLAAVRRRKRAAARLRANVERVAREQVLAPAQRVLDAYAQARQALTQAGR
ncbi:ABC transporter [Catellatospora sp. KI3]|uniref:ABC transporter n=1 Tax=Catellatospora sp. KI3 TaxID=3041620 RepID=UPI00248248A7|nr:ABC transporter [Catellatospora sp. KI3]MDI1462973.1 ABC transporter [Catellatospora sp. KI3]